MRAIDIDMRAIDIDMRAIDIDMRLYAPYMHYVCM